VASAPTPAKTADATSGTGAGAPAEEPLAIRIATHIRQAESVRTLGRIADRIDALVSEGQLSADEASDLHDAVSRRHDVIEPKEVTNG
jgi:hypothetical protein